MVDRLTRCILVGCLTISLAYAHGHAQDTVSDLSNVSLEDLTRLRISVSSFARKDEDLWKTPAAVFVITREDISRSSATSIPELLRIVPGMQVTQLNASNWAISARGFNNAYADKLLVLVDGRSVYSEIFSGVPWDQVDRPLDQIERIEVIRGPGAAVWGTNAVNGVVNIITRPVRTTLGGRVEGHVGRINESTNIRYGNSLSDRAQYQAYASYINREPLETATGGKAFDGANTVRAGGRVEWQRTWMDSYTLSGDIYGGHLKQLVEPGIALQSGPNGQDKGSISGGFLLGRWTHKQDKSDTALQVYYSDQSRFEVSAHVRNRTADIDFQDHIVAGKRNDLVWGSEFRYTVDTLNAPVPLTVRPAYNNYLADGFLQDEITLVPDRLFATLGIKVQDGTLAHFQVQPSARLLWMITPNQTAWIAASKSVVAPAILQTELMVPFNIGNFNGVTLTGVQTGNHAFKPEVVYAYEAGYRTRLQHNLTLDFAGFCNDNRRITSDTSTPPVFVPTPEPHILTVFLYTNDYRARSGGVEAAVTWKPRAKLAFQGSYAWMQERNRQVVPALDMQYVAQFDNWNTPRNTFAGTATWNFASKWSANGFLSHVGEVPITANSNAIVPAPVSAYTRLDLHVTRKIGQRLELDAGGTNLQSARHLEFGSGTGFVNPAYIPRSIFLNAAWSF